MILIKYQNQIVEIKNQKGFAPIIILFVIVAVVLIAEAYYLKRYESNKVTQSDISTNQNVEVTPIFSIAPRPVITPKPTNTPAATIKPTVKPTSKPTSTPTSTPAKRPIAITGFSYEDRNDNGIMDSDDPRLPNMQLYFYDSKNPSTLLDTVFTDDNGDFMNTLYLTGNMIVTPSTYNNFRPRGGSLTFSDNNPDVEIGFRSASSPGANLTGILEGNIYNDENRNGVRDNGESTVYYEKLYLLDSSGNYYNTVENAQTTDAGGHFKFVNLPADRTFTIRLSNDDKSLEKTDYQFTLSPTNTQNTNIEIPIHY